MPQNRKRAQDQKDLTGRYMDDDVDEDRVDRKQRFGQRSRLAQGRKIEQTALLRAAESAAAGDVQTLPIGEVWQVFSLYSMIESATGPRLCVMRKTLSQLSDTSIVVGDRVHFRDTGSFDESGRAEAVIEQILPRQTILTRSDSFDLRKQHPIVANSQQMLIVASLVRPTVKWGLIDRMLIAAQSGGLRPIICLNKIDLAVRGAKAEDPLADAIDALRHYQTMGIQVIQTIAVADGGAGALDQLRNILRDQSTVLAGHSGVGKSSLIAAIQPGLDIRIGAISNYNDKGRHTTTSARRYALAMGGSVIDTPGVKMFGLWGVTRENLENYFPDVSADTAPEWRVESFKRIAASLRE